MTRHADARRSVAITSAPVSFGTPLTIAVVAFDFDVGAEAHELLHVHHAILEDRLGDDRRAFRPSRQRHELRLHVGGEAGVWSGAQTDAAALPVRVTRMTSPSTATSAPASRSLVITASSDSGSVPRTAALAAGRGNGREIRPRLDAVGHDGVRRAVQFLYALDDDPVGPRARRCSRPSRSRQRARSTISGSRAAFSSTVVPSASVAAISRFSVPVTVAMSNTHLGPAQPPFGIDVAVIEVDRGAHGLQALDVLVDGAQSDRTATGKRHARLAAASEQRTERQDRRAHRLHELVGRERPVDARSIEHDGARLRRVERNAHLRKERLHRAHVVQARHVGERQGLGREQRSAQQRQRRVFGARCAHLAAKWNTAIDAKLIHVRSFHCSGVSVCIDSAWISSRMRSPSAA